MKKTLACIDIGSNSVVLSICELDKLICEIFHDSYVTQLGKNLKIKKIFDKESFDKTIDSLMTFKKALEKYSVMPSNIRVVATEACRNAVNRQELFDQIYEILNVHVELVSGEEEARLCLLGQKLLSKDISEAVLVDIGGSSTEVIDAKFKGVVVEPSYVKSFKLGVVKLRDCAKGEHPDLVLENEFKDLPDSIFKGKKVFFSAGSMTTLASMMLQDQEVDLEKINGLCLERDFIKEEIEKILMMDDNELVTLFPQVESRIQTIRYGAMILNYFFQFKNLDEVVFTSFGLRHGAIIQKCGVL